MGLPALVARTLKTALSRAVPVVSTGLLAYDAASIMYNVFGHMTEPSEAEEKISTDALEQFKDGSLALDTAVLMISSPESINILNATGRKRAERIGWLNLIYRVYQKTLRVSDDAMTFLIQLAHEARAIENALTPREKEAVKWLYILVRVLLTKSKGSLFSVLTNTSATVAEMAKNDKGWMDHKSAASIVDWEVIYQLNCIYGDDAVFESYMSDASCAFYRTTPEIANNSYLQQDFFALLSDAGRYSSSPIIDLLLKQAGNNKLFSTLNILI